MGERNNKRKRGYEEGLKSEFLEDLELGRMVIQRAVNSTWFEWDSGSALIFWRWPSYSIKDVKYGGKIYISGKLLTSWEAQNLPRDPTNKRKLLEKVATVIHKGYLEDGLVKNLTSFFAVPKGDDDIRVVYDASKSGLNVALWAPNFGLPTIDTVLRSVGFNSWMGDADFGEHFLNFPLDKGLRPYAGVDVTDVQ